MKPDIPNFMDLALEQAQLAADRGEVPVGAVVVDGESNEVLAKSGNRVLELKDPTAHAEMLALREAASNVESERLTDAHIYVTLEPCPMCATAISFARIRRVYYGAPDTKGGGIDHGPRIFSQATCHHKPEVYGGINESAAAALLRDFFSARR